jgi:copper chaperone NosL
MMRLLLVATLLLAACASPGPREVVVGTDLCQHCHMTVADPRFVSQLVTTTGRVLVYDDAGCLATALQDEVVTGEQVRSLWVTDFLSPAGLLEAPAAWFVRAPSLSTPMASGLAAVATAAQADSLATALGGEVLRWDAVRISPHGH